MKQLRILTGRHAGTDLTLSTGRYRISSDPEADIQIIDWTDEELNLEVSQSGEDMSTATFTLGTSEHAGVFVDFVPNKFAEIVLCLGSVLREQWPSDITLLQRLLDPRATATDTDTAVDAPAEEPTAEPAQQPTPRDRRRWMPWAAVAAAVVMAGGFYAVVSSAARAAKEREPKESPIAKAQRAIERSGVHGVIAKTMPKGVVVEGMLASGAEVARLRAELAEFPAGAIQHRYAAASEIAQNISEALGAPGIRVSYVSKGDFLVTGEAVYAKKLQSDAQRLVNDLAPLVRSIQVTVTDLPPPQKMPTGAMLQADGMEYVQSRDGTKYVSISTAPVLELKNSESGQSNRSVNTETQGVKHE
ncbi:MAG: hypothetical protein JF606_19760 [Burkholderiales bacterium]|nr:hypothetical protein [Burkholderiales bacterium]